MATTIRAAAITTARLGSQPPLGIAKTSRNARTFSGRIMPEMNSPHPKTKPQIRLERARMSGSDKVTRQRDHGHGGCHENRRSSDRAWRKSRDAADAVS